MARGGSAFEAELKKAEELFKLYGRRERSVLFAYYMYRLRTLSEELNVERIYEEAWRWGEGMLKGGKSLGYILEQLRGRLHFLEEHASEVLSLGARERKSASSVEELRRLLEGGGLRVSYAALTIRGEHGRLYVNVENSGPSAAYFRLELQGLRLERPLGVVRVEPGRSVGVEVDVVLSGEAAPKAKIVAEGVWGLREAAVPLEVREALKRSYRDFLGKSVEPLKALEPRWEFERMTVRRVFGRWEVLGLIGRGGMGETYLAKSRDGGEYGVVKVSTSRSWDVEKEWRILREISSKLRGEARSHVVEALDYGVADGVPYIVLRYYSRGNLSRACGSLKPRDALIIALQLGGTLKEIYDTGTLLSHGDIKPENVLIDDEGRPVLADFGAAYDPRVTVFHRPATPNYGCKAADSRADVYALGRLIVDMVAGIGGDEEDVTYPLSKIVKMSRKKQDGECSPEELPNIEEFLNAAEELLPLL